MSANDVATNPNQGSDQKSDANKQDQAGSGTDDPKQVNGKNVIGKCISMYVLFSFFSHRFLRNVFGLNTQQQLVSNKTY